MARSTILAVLVLAAFCGYASAQIKGVPVTIQFDNTLSRVNGNQKTVVKYIAEKLCRIPVQNVLVIKGVDQSSVVNHKSTVQYFCAGQDTAKIISNCNGMWNRHQVKDEIKDHTTPDIEVQKVLSCGPAMMYTPPARG